MNTPISLSPSARTLRISTNTWFIFTLIGQFIFVLYITLLYFKSGLLGDFEKWNTATPHGYVSGDLIGNVNFGIHMILAGVITFLGPLQLIPYIRKTIPLFHRISGRIYIVSAYLIAGAGLYLTWERGTVGGISNALFITTNALIIFTSATFAIRYALKKDFSNHREWAIRLFLAMSGVWFFRVFLMMWLVIHQAPVGFDPETFTGPFLIFLSFMVHIFPQIAAYFYFKAQKSNHIGYKWGFSAFLWLVTLGTLVGVFAATFLMWFPRV